jgi:prolycopene isomerase
MARFAVEFRVSPHSTRSTWGQMMDSRVRDPRLKAILSSQWGYYGLPLRSCHCFYALPFLGYLQGGGFYPKGRSQDISNAFARLIEGRGGRILLNTKAAKISTKGGAASGVTTADGRTFTARVVVSNASPFATLGQMIDDQALVADYFARCSRYSVSLSSFQVFLGLKEDLARKVGVADSEVFCEPSYDPEASYASAVAATCGAAAST